jgi:quercetin dioxygenase-like cupin family protein
MPRARLAEPLGETAMTYTRIYADANGETHLEDVDPGMKASDHSSMISEMIAARGVIFRVTRGNEYFIDWHNAPRRQFVVNLSGEVEITVSDGEKRRFGPGSILLAEDVGGKGHISRGIGDSERRVMFIPLADGK